MAKRDTNDPMALTLDHEGERLTFKATYATIVAMEKQWGEGWRDHLAGAMQFSSLDEHVALTALFTGKTAEEINTLSPPITKAQSLNVAAWRELMEGPEGLRDYLKSLHSLDNEEDGESTEGKSSGLMAGLHSMWSSRFGLRSE